ncbi:tyrosine-type recombinase/integrase [Desulfitobacterium sp. PCE1]|uniref:tyrosine-type recombinase/integrase n=1 Tax=Desulfitobacterium sp. PCE1 TaxID=146907 RepID=UPI00037F467E|nr:tyrosine-type recombinase/integrase [Desulfitobacterium sp. PCE1]
MEEIRKLKTAYLECCSYQKNLNYKTIKAYTIDLNQFIYFMEENSLEISKAGISAYITQLHKLYKPKSIKRKIACLKAFFSYLEYEEVLEGNPFKKINVRFQEPFLLPRTIPINTLQEVLSCAYQEASFTSLTEYKLNAVLRNIAVLELLFATGLRVSELCSLKADDIDLINQTLRVTGKGARERIVQIVNSDVLTALTAYYRNFSTPIQQSGFFFVNRLKRRLSEQSVRFMINNYVEKAGISLHITPHMFRHSFATLLLEEDVDIRYIQKLLGHSSITTTQIYTHVTSAKQKDILATKHPRNKFTLNKG